jgi:5-formyltetrahydrofolate cyclo-ligase
MFSEAKENIRERIWKILSKEGVARFPWPIEGRIPNFEGSVDAAERILKTKEFEETRAIKVNPDYAQVEVRRGVLRRGKMLIMPSPRLKEGFLILDPGEIEGEDLNYAATIKGSNKFGQEVNLENLPPVDLIVCGSVAVTKEGIRVGKGGGYSELEYAILKELDLIGDDTPIMTSVHDLQIVEDAVKEKHDFTVDVIATPTQIFGSTGPRQRPPGVFWEEISEDRMEDMPVLKKLRELKEN